jgi:hypothetical protein
VPSIIPAKSRRAVLARKVRPKPKTSTQTASITKREIDSGIDIIRKPITGTMSRSKKPGTKNTIKRRYKK